MWLIDMIPQTLEFSDTGHPDPEVRIFKAKTPTLTCCYSSTFEGGRTHGYLTEDVLLITYGSVNRFVVREGRHCQHASERQGKNLFDEIWVAVRGLYYRRRYEQKVLDLVKDIRRQIGEEKLFPQSH